MPMTVRTLRFGLWSFAATCVAAATVLVCLAAAMPLDLAESPAPGIARGAAAGTAPSGAADKAGQVWDTDLRRPLHDDPPPPPAPTFAPQTAVVQPPPQLTLVGTAVEPGHSYALFSVDGKTQFKAVGDEINGAKLIAIREADCTLLWNGREIVIAVQRAAGAAAASPAPPPRFNEDR